MGLGFGNVLRPGSRTGPAPIWHVFIHLFTPRRKYPVLYTVITYRRRNSEWIIHSTTHRELDSVVVAWYHAWPALAEKRLQSAIQRRELQALRRAV